MSTVAVGIVGFLAMVGLMLVGMPIAAVMLLLGLAGGVMAYGFAFFSSSASVAWGVMSEYTLTAIPLFVMLGELLLRSGIADRMYTVFAAWLGRLPGGLLHTNIGCCALFAATSGSSVATAATIGTVALPSLRKNGYPMPDSLGSLAAGGTLGIMIPPSINFIIYGSMTNTSVGKLFIAGIIPGLALAGCFMLWITLRHRFAKEKMVPVHVPLAERIRLLRYLVEPLLVFGLVMGTLYSGIATATESAALGLVTAFILIALQGRLTLSLLETCFLSSARTTGMILLIVLGAFILNLALSLTGIGEALTKWVTGFGLERVQLLLALILFYLVLGMFMDTLSMMVATIPLVFPVVSSVGVDPIWFGVFIVLMCELGLITPPVGMNLFVVQGIRTDGGPVADVIRGALPYAAIMMLFAVLIILFPAIVTWLPTYMRG
ncbi:TRAP transporter large permease [Rhabdaerophilum sp. SD176]|uniref:TRAP transporter large permease n=1 Tax=Rhabdaerophilum sp. SD176 TaxID=2983548 RepID=UPI0024DFA27D|nr:TRAP transporter large permease [Rhabdaerophilum sp. SD176]